MKAVSAEILDTLLRTDEAQTWQDLVVFGNAQLTSLLSGKIRSLQSENVFYCYDSHNFQSIDAIGSLSHLRSLILDKQAINDDDLEAISDLSNLEQLHLNSSNTISPTGVKQLAKLKQLKALYVSFIDIGIDGAQAIGKLTELQELDLRGCKIGDEGISHLTSLSNLKSLDVSSNNITEAGVNALASFNKLQELQIWGNKFGDAGAAIISNLTNLTSLNIRSAGVTDSGIKSISSLPKLRSLNAEYNKIGRAGLASIASISSLKTVLIDKVNLSETTDAKQSEDVLASMQQLESLSITSSKLTNAHAIALSKLKNLSSLNVRANQIDAQGCHSIATMNNLNSLDIRGNDIEDEGLRALCKLGELIELSAGEFNLGESNISDDGLEAVNLLRNLNTLELPKCSITDKGVGLISKLPKLENINLSYNSMGEPNGITDDGAKILASKKQLKKLNLLGNEVSTAGAIALSSLPELTDLDLSRPEGDPIEKDAATALASMKTLQKLSLYGNQLSEFGVRVILDTWYKAHHHRPVYELDLANNIDSESLFHDEVYEPLDWHESTFPRYLFPRYEAFLNKHPDNQESFIADISKVTSDQTNNAELPKSGLASLFASLKNNLDKRKENRSIQNAEKAEAKLRLQLESSYEQLKDYGFFSRPTTLTDYKELLDLEDDTFGELLEIYNMSPSAADTAIDESQIIDAGFKVLIETAEYKNKNVSPVAVDHSLLMQEKVIAWHFPKQLSALETAKNEKYSDMFSQFSRISNGGFDLQDIAESWSEDLTYADLEIELNKVKHTHRVHHSHDTDFTANEIKNCVDWANRLLESTENQFFAVTTFHDELCVVWLSQQTKKRLEAERQW